MTPTMQGPGFYPGTGQAHLLNANHQYFLWKNQRVSQDQKSVAVQLGRLPGQNYPFAAGFQIQFDSDPGVFEVDVQGAEDDVDGMYYPIETITAVNASFVGRCSVQADYPKFVRFYIKSLVADPISITAIVTR